MGIFNPPTGGSGGSGTVTSVSVTTANGVSGSVATATTTPAITLTLGAITPTTVNGATITTTTGTLTLVNGSSLITAGAFATTLTATATTNVTLPTTGTLVNSAVTTLSSLASIGTITTGVWTGTTIALANGGTGQTSAANAINALVPAQGSSSGKFLTTDGSVVSWGTASGSGTVNSGTSGQMAYYASTAAAVSGNANATISNGSLTLGVANTTIGKLLVNGNTSGTITIAPQAAAGTYNFNLPTTAGTAGQVLTSQGGVATAMTWGDVAVSPLTTKGDIWAYTSTNARLAVGTDGQVLSADSAQATGLKWIAATGTGTVTGPVSSTDNAMVRWDGTGGVTTQNSGVIVDDSNNVSGVGTLASAAHTITSTSATALTVGANGATNPALLIDASTASSATGVSITSAASAGGVILAAIGGTNETLRLASKGSGSVSLRTSATDRLIITSTTATFIPTTSSTASVIRFSWNNAADTGLTAGAEAKGVVWDMSATRQHASNTGVTLQREFLILAPTYSFASATGTITDAATFAIDQAPIVGTNAAITNSWAIYVGSGNCKYFGKNVFDSTITAGGTTGNQTINKPSGTVNIAATGTTVTVTNSLCTTSSIVVTNLRTNDSTATIKNCVPGSGSFVITLTAAATAEISIGFIVYN